MKWLPLSLKEECNDDKVTNVHLKPKHFSKIDKEDSNSYNDSNDNQNGEKLNKRFYKKPTHKFDSNQRLATFKGNNSKHANYNEGKLE